MKTKIARNRKMRVVLESKHTDKLNSNVEQFTTNSVTKFFYPMDCIDLPY